MEDHIVHWKKNVGAIKVREVVDKFVEVFIHEGKTNVHGICDILIQVEDGCRNVRTIL